MFDQVEVRDAAMAPLDHKVRFNADDLEHMTQSAKSATEFLKALGHEGRLMILCHLVSGEKSVTELEQLICSRQAAVSQQLARLRFEGLVESRREGKAIIYRLADPRVTRIVELLHEMFCAEDPKR